MGDVQFYNNRQNKAQKFTINDFNAMFPDDAACLEWLRGYLYPEGIDCKTCQRVTKHHRDAGRPSYSCDYCGHHEHPTAGTIFHKSPTPLRLWFYAIYLMSSTRCGISAKQIQRETGVTYKTAWRMFNKIRQLLSDGVTNSVGGPDKPVEADEMYHGGRRKNGTGRPMKGDTTKTPVLGMVERKTTERKGQVVARVVPDVGQKTLLSTITEYVLPDTMVYTDELKGYTNLQWKNKPDGTPYGYEHRRIKHSAGVYVNGDIHTNSIEGFWSLLKRGIGGTYHAVSHKFLQSYIDEYAFRYNHRETPKPMFINFVEQITKA
jgi:transposase-like protein